MTPAALKRFSLFAEFSDDERETLVSLLEERRLAPGKSAFREGIESEGLVLLESGRLKLRSRRTNGVVGTLDAPDHLGSASLFVLGQREVTALAEGDCVIFTLSRSALARLADDAPRAAFRLATAVVAELAGLARQGLDPLAEQSTG